MKYTSVQVTFQEVPNEISLCFLISGCPLRCRGCHSVDSWDGNKGRELSISHLQEILKPYQNIVTCICFLGGEWQEAQLIELCAWSQSEGLKTCLYTGLEDVSDPVKGVLDYLKVGPYSPARGGLSNPNTNQKFLDLKKNQILNSYFQSQGGPHGTTQLTSNTAENSIRSGLHE